MKKRILSLLLAAALTLGLTPVSSALGYIPGPVETWPGGFLVRGGNELVGYEGEGGDIEIPEGITDVGSWAFDGNREITGVTIPQGVTTIGSLAFQYCSNLTQVSIPDSVTVIETSAFARTGLTSVVIPGSVEELGYKAFGDCQDLASVTLEPGLTQIGNSVFEGSGLTQVVIPDTVTSIGAQAFRACDKLTEVTIPSSVTYIEQSAFSTGDTVFNDGLTIYCEPDSVAAAYAEEWATPVLGTFDTDGSFVPDPEPEPSPEPSPTPSPEPSETPEPSPSPSASPEPSPSEAPSPGPEETPKSDFVIDEEGVLTRYQGTATDVVIPNSVKAIGGMAFNGTGLTAVTIPDSVKSIGGMAFYGTKLTDVTIPDSVETIEDRAFGYCKELVRVDLGHGVTTIGWEAFQGCGKLAAVTIPGNVRTVEHGAFGYCEELTQVDLGHGLTIIEGEAFRGCGKLKTVTIPDSVEKIGYRAFGHVYLQGTAGGAAETYEKEEQSEYLFISGTFVDGVFVPDEAVGEETKDKWMEWREVQTRREREVAMYTNSASYQEHLQQNQEYLDSDFYGFGKLAYAYIIVTDGVQAQSDEICQGLESDWDKVFAIHTWMTENIYYDYPDYYDHTGDVERSGTAQVMLDRRTGVCHGYSLLFQALCWAQGIPCNRNVGWTNAGFHGWNLVKVGDEWRWVDTTWDTFNAYYGDGAWEKGNTRLDYFLCSTEVISVDHATANDSGFLLNPIGLDPTGNVTEPYYQIYSDVQYGQDNYLIKDYYALAGFSDEELAEASKVRVEYGLTPYEREKKVTPKPSEGDSGSSSSGGGNRPSGGGGGGTTPTPEPEPTPSLFRSSFVDVRVEDWFCADVRLAYEKGLMKGTDDTHFSPYSNTTRATIATVLFRLAGERQGNAQAAFADVVPGAWYADAVAWASGQGVVKGYDENTFAPNDNVTREQLAVMLYRYAEPTQKSAKDLSGFADAGSVSSWAAEAMTWAVDKGIITGKGGGVLDPQGLASRAEVCAMLVRFMDLK